MCLFDDALTSGSAIVSKTHSPCSQSCDSRRAAEQEVGKNISGHEIIKDFSEIFPSPLVGEGRISTRGTSVRNSGEGWCLSRDNTPGLYVILARQRAQNDKNTFLVPYCLSNLVSSKKAAFTLAEVLITLGIIGIVAAMTIPTLITSFKKIKIETDLKTSYSILQNMVKLSAVENGNPSTWSIANEDNSIFDKYFLPYLKGVYVCEHEEILSANVSQKGRCQTSMYNSEGDYINSNASKKYILSNGLGIMYNSGRTLTTSRRRGVFWLDLSRGDKLIMGKNVFTYNLIVENNGYFVTGTRDYPQKSFCDSTQISRNKLLTNCKKGASETVDGYSKGLECTAMIECNGWKIPEDYPIKF